MRSRTPIKRYLRGHGTYGDTALPVMLASDSAALSLSVDCRHSDFFTDSQGALSPVGLLPLLRVLVSP